MKSRSTRLLASALLAVATTAFTTAVLADDEAIPNIIPIEQAKSNNVNTCMKAVSEISTFLLSDGKHGAHGVWSKSAEDSPYTAFIERVYNDGSVTMNLVATPTSDGKCMAEYTKNIFFEDDCMSTLSSFEGVEVKGKLSKNVSILSHGAVDMYMHPIGKNKEYCLVIRKEVMTF